MHLEGEPTLNEDGSNSALGPTAFVTVDNARCLFEPKTDSAVSVIPPFGTRVEIIRDEGFWILIGIFGKQAWSPRSHLSNAPTSKMSALDVGIVPYFDRNYRQPGPAPTERQAPHLEVFYGPRGGCYVRTASGFRRYL